MISKTRETQEAIYYMLVLCEISRIDISTECRLTVVSGWREKGELGLISNRDEVTGMSWD
jgi:hypothetical protein